MNQFPASKVGIIIPTVNRPILLERALKSVFNQTLKSWTLIIVNDGGDLSQVEKLITILQLSYNITNQIQLIDNPRQLGKSEACNKAFGFLESEFVVILNDDDVWAYEYLSILVSQLEYRRSSDSSVRGIISLANIMHEEIIEDNVFIKWCDVPDENAVQPFNNYIHSQELLQKNLFSSSQFLFYTDVIREIGLFDSQLPIFNDWEFHIRFILRYSIFIITQPLVNLHQRFYSTNPSYLNQQNLYNTQKDFYNGRLTDLLLRKMNNSIKNSHNLSVEIFSILACRTSIASLHFRANVTNHSVADPSGKSIEELIHKVRFLESEAKKTQEWFKYLEYKIKPGYVRKGNKIYRLLRYSVRSGSFFKNIKNLVSSLFKTGLKNTYKRIKNKVDNIN